MEIDEFLADARRLDAGKKDDARRRTIISRAYLAAFHQVLDCWTDAGEAAELRRGALFKQVMEFIARSGDAALVRAGRRLASLHAWRLRADYDCKAPIPPGQESACLADAEEVAAIAAARPSAHGPDGAPAHDPGP